MRRCRPRSAAMPGPGLELTFAASNGDAFEIEPLASGAALLTAPNTILSPHVAGRTRDNLRRMVQHWAGNIRRHAAGLPD